MKYKKFFITMLIVVLLASLASLAAPFFLQSWENRNVPLAIQRIGFIIAVIVISKLLAILLTVYRERFAKEYNKKNFQLLLYRFFNMDYDSIIQEGSTNLLERISIAVNSIYTYMTSGFISIWSSSIVSLICLIFIAQIHVMLAVLMLIVLPINYFGFRLLNKELAKRSEQMQKNTSKGFQEIISCIQQVEYIKQLPHYEHLMEGLAPSIDKIYGSMARVNEYAQSMTVALNGITEIIQNLVLIFVVYAFSLNSVSPYTLILATLVLPLYFSSVSSIVNSNIDKRNFDIAKSLEKELKEKQETDGQDHLEKEIETIEFSVDEVEIPQRKLPFHANVTLKKGDIAQVCGVSGTGKSSFAKALLKFRSINGVRYNDMPIGELGREDVRERVELVPQNVPIICGTLRDNLLLGSEKKRISDEQLVQNEILKTILENKTLDDEILENSANLSGGEQQKIALVRALINHPDVLILDEICSNIDADMAAQIYHYLDATREQRITILITHDELPEGLANFRLNQR